MVATPGSKLRLAVTRALPPEVMQRFAAAHTVWVNPDPRSLTADELQRAAASADALVVVAQDRLDKAAIDKLPASVRIIATYSVGIEHIDLDAAKARGIAVLSTPDVLSDAVAEMAILLMLGAARRVHEGGRMLYDRQWTGWTPTQLVGIEVTGRRIGILGMGRIGRTIARRARGFDMAVHYHNRSRLSADLEEGATYHPTLDVLMQASDVLVVAAPSSPDTRGSLNAARFALMPPEAVVVNIARGDLVDDDGLIGALKTGKVAAAGLDVFAGEPRLDPRYLELPNVFLQPHQGSSTLTARLKMGQILLDGMAAIAAGRHPVNRLV